MEGFRFRPSRRLPVLTVLLVSLTFVELFIDLCCSWEGILLDCLTVRRHSNIFLSRDAISFFPPYSNILRPWRCLILNECCPLFAIIDSFVLFNNRRRIQPPLYVLARNASSIQRYSELFIRTGLSVAALTRVTGIGALNMNMGRTSWIGGREQAETEGKNKLTWKETTN